MNLRSDYRDPFDPELGLADFSRQALVYGIDRLKRPKSVLQKRIDYFYKVNDRWRKPSSTS